MKKRYFPKKDKKLPKGYDSFLEVSLHENELKDFLHHTEKLEYTSTHTYQPDFVHPSRPDILIEAKGRMVDTQTASKYKHIRDSNPDKEIIFEKPELPMPLAKKRKDGTKQTHAEWAEKNNFRWFTRETLPNIEEL